jgi:hypothetical protein
MTDGYTCVATVADLNEANVAAARLHSEGFEARVHGEATGPFPVTIGRLAETQIWVRADDAHDAALVLEDIGIACDSDL